MTPSDFLTNVTRFWSHVDKTDPCWTWIGERNRHGYGRFDFWTGGRRNRVLAHRLALQLTGEQLNDGDVVMHTCDNPPCVNPAHLLVGTQGDNVRDARDKGRLDLTGLALGLDARHGHYPAKEAS